MMFAAYLRLPTYGWTQQFMGLYYDKRRSHMDKSASQHGGRHVDRRGDSQPPGETERKRYCGDQTEMRK